jgi:hypothetical protein
MLEVVDAAISVWGPQRVGLHLSPRADIYSMGDSDLLATFTHVSREMDKRNIAFLLVREHQANDSIGAALKRAFGGVYVANEQFTVAQAEAAIADGAADAVAFGVKFIANPDLPARIKSAAPLNEPDSDTFYIGGAKGYVDYPSLQRSPEVMGPDTFSGIEERAANDAKESAHTFSASHLSRMLPEMTEAQSSDCFPPVVENAQLFICAMGRLKGIVSTLKGQNESYSGCDGKV